MPKEQENFQNAVNQILEVVMFESWLRFYFVREMKDEKAPENAEPHLFVIIPEKAMEKIQSGYPHLLPLAQDVQNKEISFEISKQAVCKFVVEHIDGKIIPRDTSASILDSISFQVRLQMFNTWVQLHESQLEQRMVDFATWKTLFFEWRETDKAHEYMEKLTLSMQKTKPVTE